MPRGVYPRKPGVPRGQYRRRPLEERFLQKFEVMPDGCWQWTAHIGSHGYGVINSGGAGPIVLAHRVAYELYKGPISEGLFVDHLCRNRRCVNPEHLELVTNRTNFLRGDHPLVIIHRTGRCVRGHELTPETYYVSPKGKTQCRICRAERRQRGRLPAAVS